jgi:hypothetical protein
MTNSLNLQEIDQEQALNLARFFIKSNQNVFLFGRRGVGKTHIAMQAAKDCNFKVNYINLSVIERPDLAGYPDMHAEGDVISYKSPYFLPKLASKEKPSCVLLFDEVDKAPAEITAPLLEILQFGKVNGQPINVAACILTGNLLSEGAYSNEISSALLDRGAKYILSFHFDKWLEWARANAIHDLVLGFLTSNPDLTCGELENTCYASPSPRGWTMVSDVLIKAKELKVSDIDTIFSLVSGFVGYQVGIKFKMWYEYYRKFEPHILSLIETGECLINYSELGPTEKIVFCITTCHLTRVRFVQESKSQPQYQYTERLAKWIKDNKVDPEIQAHSLSNSFPFEFVADKRYQLYKSKLFFELNSKLSGVKKKK